MEVGSSLPPHEPATVFYVGQHETDRSVPFSLDLQRQTQDLGYDFLTTRITNSIFHARVLGTLSKYRDVLATQDNPSSIPMPTVAPLTPADTILAPEDSNTSLIALVSAWIDLGSADPIIAAISRQVLNMEMAYAAFCGINNVMVAGPLAGSDALQFARAIQEALSLGPYLQLHVLMPVTGELEEEAGEDTHLSELASELDATVGAEDEEPELYGTWDTWHAIRTLCGYSPKLSIGTKTSLLPSLLPLIILLQQCRCRVSG